MAMFRTVNDVDKQPARFEILGRCQRLAFVLDGNEREPGFAVACIDANAARPLDQPSFGIRRFAFADQYHLAAFKVHEDRQLFQYLLQPVGHMLCGENNFGHDAFRYNRKFVTID